MPAIRVITRSTVQWLSVHVCNVSLLVHWLHLGTACMCCAYTRVVYMHVCGGYPCVVHVYVYEEPCGQHT